MTATDLLQRLRDRGIELWASGDRLRYSAPEGTLSDDLREEIRRKKPELLDLLAGAAAAPAPEPVASPVERSKGRSASQFSLFGNNRTLAALSSRIEETDHPYARYVRPQRSFLFRQLGMARRFVRGDGCRLEDERGVSYLDFVAQFGALPFGHGPDAIWDALLDLRRRKVPAIVTPSLSDAAGELARRLLAIAPPGMRYVAFANSGTEAIEVALKIVRAATGRPGILSTTNSFHGLTLGAMSATGKAVYQEGFGAPVPGFDCVPFGDAAAVRAAFAARPGHHAAFVVEPIQGEGGIVDAPRGYLAEVQRACREAGALLVVDEVQTGLGRTGTLFACEADGVTPDVMPLAKALGGGLVPAGACLYTEAAYTKDFDLRHSSTFAGNALACAAALATLDLLEADDRALLERVREGGERIRGGLLRLAGRYPGLVRSIRGRGYMMGVELALDETRSRPGILHSLHEQSLLLHLIVGYLLGEERVRVMPSFTGGTVLRLEPPLVAGAAEIDELLAALDRVLDVLARGDTGALVGHLVGRARPEGEPPLLTEARRRLSARGAPPPPGGPADGRFAFVIHMLEIEELVAYDSSLAPFSRRELLDLQKIVRDTIDPFPLREIWIESPTGRRAWGDLILVPRTAEELVGMEPERSLEEIRLAVEIARGRDARVVGLGAFSSVVTQGGLALQGEGLVALTSGNSFTVAIARQAIERAAADRGLPLASATAAIIGSTGIIGRGLSFLLAERFRRLVLVGSPAHPERSRARLAQLAAEIARDHPGVLVETTLDLDAALPAVDVVVCATSSVETLVHPRHLAAGAIVCDVSRPFNVSREVAATRPDVTLLEGGLVRFRGRADFGPLMELEEDVIVACAAETILLALEHRYDRRDLCGPVAPGTIREIEAIGARHGFEVVLRRPGA